MASAGDVVTHIHIDSPRSGNAHVVAQNKTVSLKVPDGLANCGFPASREVTFDLASNSPAPSSGSSMDAAKMMAAQVDAIASGFTNSRTNSVVFAFGTNATSKRQAIVHKSCGMVHSVLSKVTSSSSSSSSSPIVAVAYGMGETEVLKDLVDPSNDAARLTETVREGPRVNDLTRKTLSSAADVGAFCTAVSNSCEQRWPAAAAPSNFNHEAIVVAVYRFESAEDAAAHAAENSQQQQQQQQGGGATGGTSEMNSLHFIVLPDNQRPALCGIDSGELKRFEFAQKCIAGAAGVVGAVLAARLRVPFGKSRLTGLLKRAYNAERGNKFNSDNKPTNSYPLLCVSAAEDQAEETYHVIALLKRLYNPLGFASSTLTLTRDMAAEKWRLDQDVVELRDELNIARQVFGYKPCIVDQPKPVANVHEVEQQRISEILKRREEARIKQQQELEARAKAEAAALIENEERSSGATLRELEDQVSRVRREFEQAEAEHGRKRQEHERHMEKIRKKRADEEEMAEQLRQQVAQLEDEINSKEVELARRKRQIDAASQDAANSRESAKKEREELQAKRTRLQAERRELRASWLEEIRSTNERLLSQVTALEAARKKFKAQQEGKEDAAAAAASSGDQQQQQQEYETESGVREDIKSINDYLPRLIALEDVPAEIEQSESIRRQLEDYFEQEKSSYAARLEEEKAKLAALEKELQELKGRAKEVTTNRRRELLAEAVKKEHHVQSIIDQVMQYLQNGVRLQKVSSNGHVRRRLFFISEDCKKIFACDLDESGAPINRRKPTMTIFVHEISEVILGVYTPSFVSFCGKSNIKQARDSAMTDKGSLMPGHSTPIPVTAVNLGKYNYRSFTLVLPKQEKTVELVCDTDSDWEAWLLALKRLVNFKTPYERKIDARCNRPSPKETAAIRWGEHMEMRNRADYELLYPEEINFCANNHISPKLFIKTREEVKQLQTQMVITVYDIRKASSMDLLRSQATLDFFVQRGIVQSIYG